MSQDNLSGSPEASQPEVSPQDTPEAQGLNVPVDAAPVESAQPEATEEFAGEAMIAVASVETAILEVVPGEEGVPGEAALKEAEAALTEEAVPVGPDFDEERPRSTLAEWTITILLLLFLTTTLVQAYVIPTGSMEDTLLIGDHLLVDKLAFAPPGGISKYLLPYTEVKRGDIIVFRYPIDITQTFVKRAIGVPGDRIRIINKEVYLNGVKVDEPYTYHKTDYIDSYREIGRAHV